MFIYKWVESTTGTYKLKTLLQILKYYLYLKLILFQKLRVPDTKLEVLKMKLIRQY